MSGQLAIDVPMSESSGHPGRSDCTTCPSKDVDAAHVTNCSTRLRLAGELTATAEATGIRYAALYDLWAHLTSGGVDGPLCGLDGGLVAVRLAVDLGWRPLIGQDPLPSRASVAAPVTVRPSEEYL